MEADPACAEVQSALALQDPEPRVRVALAECLGAMARREGPSVYERCGGALESTVNACFVSRLHSPAFCPVTDSL